MKTFWELTKRERAQLDAEAVKALLPLHLMEKGVKRPAEPQLLPILEVNLKPAGRVFIAAGVAFKTLEQAEALFRLEPQKLDRNWRHSGEQKFLTPHDYHIQQEHFFTEGDIDATQSILKTNAEHRSSNEKEQKEFAEATNAVNDVNQEVWSEYWLCKTEARKHAQVKNLFNEYLKMTEGDETMAYRFLKKAEGLEAIQAAWAWDDDVAWVAKMEAELNAPFVGERSPEEKKAPADEEAALAQ